MGHSGRETIKKTKQIVNFLGKHHEKTDYNCEGCQKFKSIRSQRKTIKVTDRKTREPLKLVHSNVCDPITPTAMGREKYFVALYDVCIAMSAVRFLKKRNMNIMLKKWSAKSKQWLGKFTCRTLRCEIKWWVKLRDEKGTVNMNPANEQRRRVHWKVDSNRFVRRACTQSTDHHSHLNPMGRRKAENNSSGYVQNHAQPNLQGI